MNRFIVLVLVSLMVAAGLGIPDLCAQPYPNRPVTLVIPGAPGSIVDIAGRMVGEELGKLLGTQFVVVDKPGAGFTLGTDFVVKSKKDGYTLLYTNSSSVVYSRVISPETVPYDPGKDLEPLGFHLYFPNAVAVQADSPWRTFKDLLDYAGKNPGKLRVSTTGMGSLTHFNIEIIQAQTGVQFTHVPFKGGESVISALLGGHVEVTFDAINKITPHVEAGKMRVLLLTGKMPELPQIPTLTDLGYKQGLLSAWFCMYGPAGMPEEVVKVLVPAVEKVIKNPELKARIEKMQFVVDYRSPAEQKKLAEAEYARALEIAKRVGLQKAN